MSYKCLRVLAFSAPPRSPAARAERRVWGLVARSPRASISQRARSGSAKTWGVDRRGCRLLVSLFALACATPLTDARAASTPHIVKGPYLQDLGADGVVVKVEVDPPS